MALQGTIKDFGLPDIFQLIGLQRKTGLLMLINDKDKESVTVTFENGMVVMSDSSQRRLEDRLGNVLVKQGKISRESSASSRSTSLLPGSTLPSPVTANGEPWCTSRPTSASAETSAASA